MAATAEAMAAEDVKEGEVATAEAMAAEDVKEDEAGGRAGTEVPMAVTAGRVVTAGWVVVTVRPSCT